MKRLFVVLVAAAFAFGLQNAAADPVKIGMITTLSTTAAYLGEDIRDGFQLAVDQEGAVGHIVEAGNQVGD